MNSRSPAAQFLWPILKAFTLSPRLKFKYIQLKVPLSQTQFNLVLKVFKMMKDMFCVVFCLAYILPSSVLSLHAHYAIKSVWSTTICHSVCVSQKQLKSSMYLIHGIGMIRFYLLSKHFLKSILLDKTFLFS